MAWYTEEELRTYLHLQGYSDEIVNELAGTYAKNLQLSFEKGQSVENTAKSSLLDFLKDEMRQAKMMRQSEVIGGNIVKEALWQGEMTAFHKLVSFLHYKDGGDTYRELLKEI